MKPTKNASGTRRSLRNATNGTKTTTPKSAKSSGDQAKSSTKVKSKVAKGTPKSPPAKAVTPVLKRKREEEKAEESAGDAANPDPEEGNKPEDNADQDETTAKPKSKRLRKKKEPQPSDEPRWQTLVDDKSPVENKKKTPKEGDRRKQSLVERDIPCAVLVRTLPRSSAHRDNDSDCEVLDGTNSGDSSKNTHRCAGPLNVDIDDVQSEAGSNFCEIIEEGSTSLDFKKLHALAKRVHLPSTIWACHVDPLSHFVSFSRFNPDFSESSSNLVDRAVVFKGSMEPFIFCNGESTSLPEEINSFETLTDVAQALQHLNAMILP